MSPSTFLVKMTTREVCMKNEKKYGFIATISIHTTKMAHMPFKPQQN